MKNLTNIIIIITMTINLTACCNTNTQNNNTQQNNTQENNTTENNTTENNTFYLWEVRHYLDNGVWGEGGIFVATADFDSFPEEKKHNFTSADVVDHYGNQTYYYTKKRIADSYGRDEWLRGQSVPGTTYEEARNNRPNVFEPVAERVQFQLNEEDEWEPVPSQNDGAPTN
jgi:hypothetical protein